jgi:cobalt-zinc-cadmium efflux system outer membrane protein
MRLIVFIAALALAAAIPARAWSAPPGESQGADNPFATTDRRAGNGSSVFGGINPPVTTTPMRQQGPGSAAISAARPRPNADRGVRRTQVDANLPALPDASLPPLSPDLMSGSPMPISLETALYGAITQNPDLVTLRNSNIASPESVEAARHFPTTLNPTIWTQIRPWVWGPNSPGGGYGPYPAFVYVSWRQPVELGHQTTHRYGIAKAAYNQQQWTVIQAELLAMVQTYRFFQTAEYRREKLRVARQLAAFNDRLLQTLKRGLEANRVAAADVTLAEVENQTTRQLVAVAEQDYAIALADLRNQIGAPDTAGAAEPLGEFVLPSTIGELQDQELVQLALQSRPDIHIAQAQVAGTCSAVKLAKGDRIPTPIIGPDIEKDQDNIMYYGFVVVSPLPILNNGKPLVRQREADHRRALSALQAAQGRAVAQVRAAVAKWNSALKLVRQSEGLTETLKTQVDRLEKLFEANQATLPQLLQARQRLIQLENSELDALWQATQAQADLLTAVGAPTLIASLQRPNQGVVPVAEANPPQPRRQ